MNNETYIGLFLVGAAALLIVGLAGGPSSALNAIEFMMKATGTGYFVGFLAVIVAAVVLFLAGIYVLFVGIRLHISRRRE